MTAQLPLAPAGAPATPRNRVARKRPDVIAPFLISCLLTWITASLCDGYTELRSAHRAVEAQWRKLESFSDIRSSWIPTVLRTLHESADPAAVRALHQADLAVLRAFQSPPPASDSAAAAVIAARVELAGTSTRLLAAADGPTTADRESLRDLQQRLTAVDREIDAASREYNRLVAEYERAGRTFRGRVLRACLPRRPGIQPLPPLAVAGDAK